MKIAFIGSHGVGKTTLCYDLAARLKRQDRAVDLVKEVARRCPLPINRDTTERYTVVVTETGIRVFDMNGVEKTVTAPAGWGYLADTASSSAR